ncbi:MAG: hypothetical protein KDI54_14335 [Gammaproteobacteria bacterium]|nr:hypothetical protein [Gammaproteobacteria bacterium]
MDSQDGPFADMQVVHVANRFAEPAPTGYRDFKAYLRAQNGHISTLRVVSRPFERSVFFETSKNKWEIARIMATAHVRAGDCSYPIVLVGDNYLFDEADSLHMIAGFASDDDAIRYGLSRMWGRLAELKKISQSVEDLIDNWFLFGENISVQLQEGYVSFDDPLEARIVDCDLDPALHWAGDQGEKYFKAPILL